MITICVINRGDLIIAHVKTIKATSQRPYPPSHDVPPRWRSARHESHPVLGDRKYAAPPLAADTYCTICVINAAQVDTDLSVT